MRDVRGTKVAVLGLARSGLAVASLLLRHGARVTGSDLRTREELPGSLAELERQGLETVLGQHSLDLVEDIDFLVVSPGVPSQSPLVMQAHQVDTPVYGEIEVASWFCSAPILAVTGSNGKTTTTTLLGHIFRKGDWDVAVAGNIGAPFSDVADRLSPDGIAVLEVSSFQLDTIDTFSPATSVLLNFSPDHLDRYSGYDEYVQAKARIFMNQREEDTAVVNADDEEVMASTETIRPRIVPFSIHRTLDEGVFLNDGVLVSHLAGEEVEICRAGDLLVPGPHNLSNAAAAAAAAFTYRLPAEVVREAVTGFRGVEHRLERVGEIEGVTFVNDSKATNVVSVQYALRSFQEPIVLIAGGREKGTEFQPLRQLVGEKARKVILVGEAAPKMQDALDDVADVSRAASMAEAVRMAYTAAREGDVVLLSPACASFDMYTNYEERGVDFKNAVRDLAKDLN